VLGDERTDLGGISEVLGDERTDLGGTSEVLRNEKAVTEVIRLDQVSYFKNF
jgi:hypothetical protein